MNLKFKVFRSGEQIREARGKSGDNVLTALSANDIFLDAPCGGRGSCGKCKVRLSPGGEEVRACQTPLEDGMSVYLPGEMDMTIAGQSDLQPAASLEGDFGVAIDIGTKTVVAHLTHLDT
ncbi:MAG: 2Fe-2S iron-sulfur cluster binding domain-containing protein, partial [Clostridiales bacterium]|nr:2Fe-2S iron-sulfur cluster binding domain-containing protein [Clostridiales bacterium]